MKYPLVSIITPSLNCGAFIEETLRSVEQQDYPNIEHIVLDSGSTDETMAVLARHPSVRVVSPAPHELTEKLSHGFAMARGEIVAWIGADDLYLPGAIRKAVEALQRNPQVALVYCNIVQVDAKSAEIGRERTRQANWEDMLTHNYIPVETAFIRREVLDRVGLFDKRYPMVLDWDFHLRISKNFPILYVDDFWSAFRVREGQRSSVYQYDYWIQARTMAREHGANLLPLYWNYWGTKVKRISRMVRNGEFRTLTTKLGKHIRSVARHQATRNRTDY